MSNPSIILTGFSGTGKSTVGRLLEERLNRQFIDTNELIVQESGMSIEEIYQPEGEAVFRVRERSLARRLAGRANLIVASGDRFMLDPVNATLLGQNNWVFWLEAGELKRPLLSGHEPEKRIASHLARQAEGYSQFTRISSDGRTAEMVATQIAEITSTRPAPFISRFPVSHPSGRYQVLVGRGLLEKLRELVSIRGQLAVVTDENVAHHVQNQLSTLNAQALVILKPGESSKNLDCLQLIYDRLLAKGIDRQSTLLALGGGVVGDIAGFAAATYMRGIDYVSCPTTVLSMVDASVGGKTGVDLPQGKNLVGTFKQPVSVIADLETIDSLPVEEFSAGLAEVVKHGLLAAPALLDQLETVSTTDEAGHTKIDNLQALIVEAILVKRDVVEVDPFEMGQRKVLNLGHTFAHAIEQASDYAISHGQAVAIGLVAALQLSADLGYCQPVLIGRIKSILAGLALPTRLPLPLSSGKILSLMSSDKKKAAGRLQFVLIKDIGEPFVSDQVPEVAVLTVIQSLGAG